MSTINHWGVRVDLDKPTTGVVANGAVARQPQPIVLYGDDDQEIELPSRFDVCPRCHGTGSHVNPNIDGHGITSEEWDRDWDEESREAYFDGAYDVPCYECKGERVISVVDEERCDPEMLKRYYKQQREHARWEAEDRATRRMENGGYDY